MVALTGFMASGKTTFGRAAAKRLGWHFIDLDEAIAARYGTPADIFAAHGEVFFRNVETKMLVEILHDGKRKEGKMVADTILALGGGTVLQEENLRLLKAHATLIWLDTAFDIIRSELDSAERPLLCDKSAEKIRALYDVRRPLYAAAADFVFPISSTDYEQVIRELTAFLMKHNKQITGTL